jgi:hypothetical protein
VIHDIGTLINNYILITFTKFLWNTPNVFNLQCIFGDS